MRFDSSRALTCTSAFFDSSQDPKPHAAIRGDLPLPTTSSSSSSSIGNNSDLSSERSMGDQDAAQNEAQSSYNGSLDMMHSLEQILPLSRGISKFYEGKSKSFTSLADCSSSPSMQGLAKPDNAYTRKRRNVMAFNHIWNKNRSFTLKSSNINGGISKRPLLSSSRSTLALAVAMNNSDSSSSITSEDSVSNSSPPPPPFLPPPSHPRISVGGPSSPFARNFSAWRSFSLADLQQCATTATMKMPSSSSLTSETALSKLT